MEQHTCKNSSIRNIFVSKFTAESTTSGTKVLVPFRKKKSSLKNFREIKKTKSPEKILRKLHIYTSMPTWASHGPLILLRAGLGRVRLYLACRYQA